MIKLTRWLGISATVIATTASAQAPDCVTKPAQKPKLPVVLPIELHANHVFVHVCRGTTPLLFVLDTGAGSSTFDLQTAKGLGVTLGAPFQVGGAGAGTVGAARITPDAVVIPGASINVPIAAAIDFSSITGPEGGQMQGILGADFISRYVVAIDYRNSELRLYDRDVFKYDGAGTTVPFTIVGAFIHVRGDVGLADGMSLPGDFVVDVGSSLALALAKPFVENNRLRDRIGSTVHRPSGRGVGGAAFADVGRVATFRIGGVAVQRPVTYLYGDSAGVFSGSSLGDGNVGGDILRRFTVYFDYRGRRMILEPHAGTNEPFETDMSGLQLTGSGSNPGLSVAFVVPSSAAWDAGLVKGDTVVSVNGNAVNASSLELLRQRLRREGESVEFTVRRNGADVIVRLVTRRIV
jgi:hypothetical protein